MSHDEPNTEGGQGRPAGHGDDATGPVGGPDQTAPLPRDPSAQGGHHPPQAGGPQQPPAPMYGGWQQPGTGGQARPPQPQHGGGQAFGAPPQGMPSGQGGQQPYATAYAEPHQTSRPRAKHTRRAPWIAVPLAAIIAACLASGGTYALTQSDGGSNAASGTSTTVVKTNPADFGNAGQVNWSATASKVKPSVVSITVIKGQQGDQGSGVVLDDKGNIATNNHVVSLVGKGGTVKVTMADNQTYDATVVGTDPSTDLAVVRLKEPPKDLKPITLGNDHKLVVGQPVMAIGNPLGLSSTVTTGIVSALNRPVTTQASEGGGQGDDNSPFPFPFGGEDQSKTINVTTNAIQTSAAINPGNSGGALVTGSGKLIGINSSIATVGQSSGSSQSGNIGIGFAIPVSVVKNITSQLIDNGKAVHAQVGVSVRTASVDEGDATQLAAKIVKVNSGSPADKAGLKSGDIVTAIDGNPVTSSDSLVGYVRAKTVGEKIKLTIVRDGKQKNVTVTLGADSSGT